MSPTRIVIIAILIYIGFLLFKGGRKKKKVVKPQQPKAGSEKKYQTYLSKTLFAIVLYLSSNPFICNIMMKWSIFVVRSVARSLLKRKNCNQRNPRRPNIMRPSFLSCICLLCLVGLPLWQSESHATIYSCQDRDGSIRFTNAPVSGSCRAMNFKGTNVSRGYHERSGRGKIGRSNPNSYDSYIKKVGSRYRVDPYLIKAVIKAESGFNRYAVSKKGAEGLMQLMPGTAKELRVRDSFDPKENIDGGTRYLRKLLDIFDNNLSLTLAAYNAGPTLVKRHNKIPQIPETQKYVKKVMRYYKTYKGQGLGSILRRSSSTVPNIALVEKSFREQIL